MGENAVKLDIIESGSAKDKKTQPIGSAGMIKKQAIKVGLIGGTFDPVHYGHLLAAEEAYRVFGLSEVVFIPTGSPPHKTQVLTRAEDRWMMVVIATNECPYFSVSRIEIDRVGNCYTTDTLKELRANPDYDSAEFYFIVGLDALLLIESWKEPRELLTLCRFIAISRSGYSFVSLNKLPEEYRRVILTLEIPHLDISSSMIRSREKRGEGIKYLVPPAVESYIKKHSLYL